MPLIYVVQFVQGLGFGGPWAGLRVDFGVRGGILAVSTAGSTRIFRGQ